MPGTGNIGGARTQTQENSTPGCFPPSRDPRTEPTKFPGDRVCLLFMITNENINIMYDYIAQFIGMDNRVVKKRAPLPLSLKLKHLKKKNLWKYKKKTYFLALLVSHDSVPSRLFSGDVYHLAIKHRKRK